MRLWKISYVSVATAPSEMLDANVYEICTVAEQHNARAGITGVLTFHAGRFAQLLEGPEPQLRALMIRIGKDARHHSLKVLADSAIRDRRYGSWSMAYRSPNDFVRDQLGDLLAQTAAVAGAKHRAVP